MIEEADGVGRDALLRCDVCLVGAGAAGITLAAELAGSGLAVVLLESGGVMREAETQDLYRGRVTGAPQFPLELSRLRWLGGTTNHWAGMCRPFDALDFEPRDWVPHSGWPITRAELDPYYARAHEVCDLGPCEYAAAAWPGWVDPAPRLAEDPDVELKLVQHSKPTRWAGKYAALLEGPGGPRVILHANAWQLRPDPELRSVREVEVRTLAGNRFRVVARAYVLAAGGIENARLLLLSNEVAPRGLGNERDLVGRYFMDHPAAIPFGVLLFEDPAQQRLGEEQRVRGIRLAAGLALRREVLERHRLLSTAVYMRPPMTLEDVRDFEWWNIVQEVRDPLDGADLEWVRFLQALAPEGSSRMATICWIRSEQAPTAESRVRLGEERDALGQRRVVLDWRLAETNGRSFREAAKLYARVLTRSGVGRIKLTPWLLEDDPGWWQRVTPGWHHIGTTRMADDPERGVVDPDCRVFGLDNLFVAGSSVFPTSSYINPTLTLVALAIRLADRLKERLRR